MRSRLFFISGHSCVLMNRSISGNSPAQLEIKDTMNEVKYGCLWLLVEVFMKVMNGLVMTLEDDKRFLCVWLLYYVSNFADSRMKVPRYRSSPTSWDNFFFCVFSSSEVLAKITSIRSKLPTAACWSQEKKRGNCEANLLYVESDFGTTEKSFTVFFARWGVKLDRRVN